MYRSPRRLSNSLDRPMEWNFWVRGQSPSRQRSRRSRSRSSSRTRHRSRSSGRSQRSRSRSRSSSRPQRSRSRSRSSGRPQRSRSSSRSQRSRSRSHSPRRRSRSRHRRSHSPYTRRWSRSPSSPSRRYEKRDYDKRDTDMRRFSPTFNAGASGDAVAERKGTRGSSDRALDIYRCNCDTTIGRTSRVRRHLLTPTTAHLTNGCSASCVNTRPTTNGLQIYLAGHTQPSPWPIHKPSYLQCLGPPQSDLPPYNGRPVFTHDGVTASISFDSARIWCAQSHFHHTTVVPSTLPSSGVLGQQFGGFNDVQQVVGMIDPEAVLFSF
ncbi:uncharacterized protein O3C94_003814 [Discoglossus pictus]